MDCREIRALLSLHAYGDAEPSVAIEQHLASCAPCAAVHASLVASRESLSTWAPIEDPADVSTIAAAGEAFIAERRRTKRRPFLVAAYGIAAGLVAFVTASAVGTTIERGDGTLRITFGSSATAETKVRFDDAALREIVASEVGERFAASLNQFADVANGWNAAQQERYADVLRAMQVETERQRVSESIRTQDLMDGMMQVVSFKGQPHRP